MDEVALIERRLGLVSSYGRVASYVCGGALAGIYFLYRLLVTHFIATYTWIIPFGIGFVIPAFASAWLETKLEQRRRVLLDPSHGAELPSARVVAELPAKSPMPVTPFEALKAPEPRGECPRDPDEGPKLLR
jgi:hypothetical protein